MKHARWFLVSFMFGGLSLVGCALDATDPDAPVDEETAAELEQGGQALTDTCFADCLRDCKRGKQVVFEVCVSDCSEICETAP